MQTKSGKRMFRFAFLFVAILTVISAFSACDASEDGVPDGTAELVVLDYLQERHLSEGDYNSYSFKVEHDYDKQSKIDKAIIELEIQYNYASEQTQISVFYSYDRASDLWSITRKGNWSSSVFELEPEKLTGSWSIDFFLDHYDIAINDVQESSVSLEYSVSCVDYNSREHVFYDHGSGTYEINDMRIIIPITLHDGFVCGDLWEEKKSTVELIITIDPQKGCYYGYTDGSVRYYE